MDIVGLVFDALASMVEDIPIIGDIVGFVASLFGNSSASNARIARLETIVSKGSSGYDDFNRSDTSSLGRGPQMTADWVTGGNGQALGVQGRAAGLVEALAPADGRRWARYPSPASSSTMTADTIVDDKKLDNQACTSVIVAANAAFTEFVYANVFGTGVYLGRGTRSGNSWSFNDWKSNTSYKVGTAERVEVRASGSGIYQLVVDNTVILEHTDVSYPIDVDHRYVGFAIQCWTAILQLPQYGWRLSAFSLKSEAGTFTAIETVETIANGAVTVANGAATTANGAVTVANGAQTAAENAVETAVTEATAAATSAAEAAAAAIGAAQQQQVSNAQAAIIGIANGLPVQPYSHSMTNHECTFDRVNMRRLPIGLTGSTASATGSGSHVHGTGSLAFQYTASGAFAYVPTGNSVEGGFIRSRWSGGRGSVVYAVGTGTSLNPIYILIGRMDPETGDVKIEYVSPDQSLNIAASGEQILNLPTEIVFDVGESMWLGIHQPGAGNRRGIFGIELASVAREGLLYPPQQKTTYVSSTVLTAGQTIPADSFGFTSPNLLWIGIGQSLSLPLPDITSYFEDFSSGAIPATMSRQAGTAAAVIDGAIMLQGGFINDGTRTYLITKKLTRNDHEISGQIRTPTTQPAYLSVRGSASTGNTRVDLEVRSTGVTLVTRGYLMSPTTLGSASFTITSGDVFKLRAQSNVFTVMKQTGVDSDGLPTWTTVLTYTDSANTIPRGSGYRYTLLGLDRDNFLNSGGWEYVLAQDLPDPV